MLTCIPHIIHQNYHAFIPENSRTANYSYELNEELDKELKFLNLYKKIDKKW